jgi:hypothetical protein
MRQRLVVCLALASLFLGGYQQILAQGPAPEVKGDSVENPLKAPIVVLVVDRDPEGRIVSGGSLFLPANASKPLGHLKGQMEKLEPILLGFARKDGASNCEGALSLTQTNLAQLKESLKALEFSNTSAAAERIEAAAAIAQLELEQKTDEKTTMRNDPLRLELKRRQAEYFAQSDVITKVQQSMKDHEEALGNVMSDFADLALAWAGADQAKQEVLYKEAKTLQPIAEQARLAFKVKQQDFKNSEAEVHTGAQFLRACFDALSSLPAREFSEDDLILAGPPRRVCTGPSRLDELVEIEVSTNPALAILLAECRFDQGGTQETFFRRVGKSNRWVARIYWPVSASSVRFTLKIPGQTRWRPVEGIIQTGRPSLTAAVKNAQQAVGIIEKKFKDANFRAAGSDNIKTVPVP